MDASRVQGRTHPQTIKVNKQGGVQKNSQASPFAILPVLKIKKDSPGKKKTRESTSSTTTKDNSIGIKEGNTRIKEKNAIIKENSIAIKIGSTGIK